MLDKALALCCKDKTCQNIYIEIEKTYLSYDTYWLREVYLITVTSGALTVCTAGLQMNFTSN